MMIIFDIMQVLVFIVAYVFQFHVFGIVGFEWLSVPLILVDILISWFIVAASELGSDRGAAAMSILEVIVYLVFIAVVWLLKCGIGLPEWLTTNLWVMVLLIIVINFGQEIGAILTRVPGKFTRGGGGE